MRRWLLPLAMIWSTAARARVSAYDHGLLARRRLPRPAVSIGALEMGGTGKTPAVATVARVLRDRGLRPGILSRGYGRRSRGPVLVSDGGDIRVDARQAGDEPTLYGRLIPGVPVAVAARREQAADLLLDATEIDVFLLDDGFQHVRVHRDADLLVVDSTAPFWEGAPPPAGRLREAPSGALRADAFLVTGDRQGACHEHLARRYPDRPVFALRTDEPGATSLPELAAADPGPPPQPVLPFCGIARPERFDRSLQAAAIAALPPVTFADHHWYAPSDIARLRATARRLGARALLTTEKDAVRLSPDEGDPPIWVWRYRLEVTTPDELFRFLQQRLAREPQGP